jgi:hypothetical protein
MQMQEGVEMVAPSILNFGIKWKWEASLVSQALYARGKSPRYELDKSLWWLHSRYGRGGEDKNFCPCQE